ncbi:tetratricopeptide repeat-containing diguanylate cyclase [Marinomonas colpomeniae]|uniref:diguanylate cyclase n=1 Tax=Marinomonas colpomeniae TaxID=2774408 RepID=A0ABR8NZ44_9GAMM|nr:GGDEF domain-containing protein [Marinomonas colpomeniae]MBD5771314.1 diguanylate cyclase [Marinomonas colpomeniae]
MLSTKRKKPKFIISYSFIFLLWHFTSIANAESLEPSIEHIKEALYSGDNVSINNKLSIFIANTDSLSEADYTPISAKISLLLRETKQTTATQNVAKWLNSDVAKAMQKNVRFRWMMIISYDLMFFTEFLIAKNMLEQELEAIKTWTPTTNDSKVTQANLYHIYGQLLVRQKLVAEALPYFYQAEKWFKEVDENHPSIFVINIILGEAFLHARDYVKAEQYAYKALNTIPEGRVDAISYLNAILASALEQQQRPEDAMKVISNYLANPVDPRQDYFLYFCLVHIEVLRDLGKLKEALTLAKDTYTLAQEIGNKDYLKDASRHLGFLQAYFGNMESAETLLRKAMDSPSDIRQGAPINAYLDYTEVLEQLGKHQVALNYFRLYHNAYIEEHERINQITIANLELHQENLRLEQQQILSKAQLALAKANENRTQLKNHVFMWAALILLIIVTTIFIMLLQLRRRSHQLHEMAVSDQLTKLGNRHAFLQALNNPSYTLLIIADIDSLKHYNDHYGHQKGDELIKNYAEQMKNVLSTQQAELFRIGGDEFAILIDHDVPIDTIEQWMHNAIQQTKNEGFSKIGASYGIAKRSEISTDYDWISVADQRMYEMKKSNKSNT